MSVERFSQPADGDDPVTATGVGAGPKVVVTAFAISQSAREALAQRLGPGHVVVDIRDADPGADIVLTPPASDQLIGKLRQMFPVAQILVTEFTDTEFGADFSGPIARSMASGVDGYFVVPTMDELASVTYQVSTGAQTVAALTGGHRASPAPSRLLGRQSGHSEIIPDATTQIRVDLRQWADQLGISPEALAPLAWPLLLQLRQQAHVTVNGLPTREWIAAAKTAGLHVEP